MEEREDWFEGQLDLDPEQLVFVDESFATTNMARRYGRAPRGVRLRAPIPYGNRKKTTLVAGLRLSGVIATRMLDGSINGDRFLAYVTEVLVPTLAPGDLVVIDTCERLSGRVTTGHPFSKVKPWPSPALVGVAESHNATFAPKWR